MRPSKEPPSVRAQMAQHSMYTTTEKILMRGELPQSFAGARRRPERSHRPTSAGPTVTSTQPACLQQRLFLSPRGENKESTEVRPVRAASAAPTRPQQQANPRNLLRPKSSSNQRKLLQMNAPEPSNNATEEIDKESRLLSASESCRKRFKTAAIATALLSNSSEDITQQSENPNIATKIVIGGPLVGTPEALRVISKRKPHEQLATLIDAQLQSANGQDVFRYAVPTHHFHRFARYDPYTIVNVSFSQVYSYHKPEAKAETLLFTSDERVIDRHIRCDFYIVHTTGLLFYCKRNATVEYQSMDDWNREKQVFEAVSKIPLFSQYKLLKAMTCWKRYYRRKKFVQAQEDINAKLYFCNPVLYATMTHVQIKLLPFHSMTLFESQIENNVYSPEHFVTFQKQRVTAIANELSVICSSLQLLLATVTKEYLSQYSTTESVITHAETCFTSRKSTIFHIDHLKRSSISPQPHQSVPEKISGHNMDADLQTIRAEMQRSRLQSYKLKEARNVPPPPLDQVKWSIAAVKRAKCSELTHFITMIDFMMLDLFQDVIIRSANDLVTALKVASGSKQPLLLLSKDAYLKAYRRFDTFGTESLDVSQLTKLLYFVFDGKLSGSALDARVQSFISVFDSNGDGDISLDEFSYGLDILLNHERMQAFDPASMSVYQSSQKTTMFRTDPLFMVTLSLNEENKLAFSPSLASVSQCIHATLNGFFDLCVHVERLIHNASLYPYMAFANEVRSTTIGATTPRESSMPRMTSLLMERAEQTASYLDVCQQIEEIIQDTTCAAQAYLKCFDPLYKSFLANNAINYDFLADQHKLGLYPLEDMQRDIKHFQNEKLRLEDLVSAQDIQLIRIQTTELKDQLVPSPERCLNEYARILPILAEQNCVGLLSYIEIASIKIQRPATKTLDIFVTYLQNLQAVNDELLTKDHEAIQTTAYFDVLRTSGFDVPEHTQAAFDLCGPELSTLKSNVTTCLARRDNDIREYSTLLTQTIDHLESNIEYLQTEACSDQMCDESIDAEKAVAFSQNLQNIARDNETKAKRLVFIRDIFNRFLSNAMHNKPLFQSLPSVISDITLKSDVWALIAECEETLKRLGPLALKSIPINEMSLILEQLTDVLNRMTAKYTNLPVTRRLTQLHKKMAHITPIIHDLCNEHLEDRHWQRLENKLQVKFEYDVDAFSTQDTSSSYRHSEISFAYFLSLQIEPFKDDIHEIVQEAVTEAEISKSLQEAIKVWETKDIPFVPRLIDHDTREILVLGNTAECMRMLEESDVLLQTIMGSSYIRPIQSLAIKWKEEVANMIDLMIRLDECQQYWDHMEFFLSSEFMRALPDQAQSYNQLEKSWKSLLEKISKNPSLLRTARATGVKEQLTALNHGFGSIYKMLEGYLELKRQNFPRFYVLSDADLTELISKCREPQAIQSYLPWCIPSLSYIEFGCDDKSLDILAVHSQQQPFSEVITLGKNLKARGYIEQWIAAVNRRLNERIQRMIRDVVPIWLTSADQTLSMAAFADNTLQSILVAFNIVMSNTIHYTFAHFSMEKALSSLRTTNTAHLNQIKQLISSASVNAQSTSLCSALLMQQLHYRDMIDYIEKAKSTEAYRDCLRYTLQEDTGDVFVEMIDLRISYGFVYHNPSRCQLIMSPLTDRYFHALFTAMRSFQASLNTVVCGPTLCGKSTLICMLGRALGRDVLQKCCTTLTRQNELEQLVTGSLLLSCSLLLKNVEYLNGSLLHFLTNTISTLTSNAMVKKHFIELNQRELHFSPGFQIVLTSVPSITPRATAYYAELLERTISLPLIPLHLDVAIHTLLYSYSFENTPLLARKLYYIWTELGAVISREDPSLSYLGMLRSAIDCILPVLPEKLMHSDVNEAQLLQLAVTNFLSREIQPRSGSIYSHMMIYTKALWFMDYMPRAVDQYLEQPKCGESSSTQGVDNVLTVYLTEAYDKASIVLNRYFTEQSLRLANSLSVSRSIIVCGASRSGKTTMIQQLGSALNILYPKCYEAFPELVPSTDYTFVTIKRLVSTALSFDRLYGGSGDSDSSILKQLMHSPVGRANFEVISPCYLAPALPDCLKSLLGFSFRTWICLDGALDMTWVEHLLSLTAQNDSTSLGLHQLSLASTSTTCDPNISTIFETIGLESASPSFLSRCAHIVMNALPPSDNSETNAPGLHHLVLQGYIKSLKTKPGTPALVIDVCSKHLLDISFIDTLLDVQVARSTKLTHVRLIQNFITLLQAMFTSRTGISYQAISQLKENESSEYQNKIELVVMWCLAWGFGSTWDISTKRLLNSVLETRFSHLEASWASNGPQCTIFDCILDIQHNCFKRCKDHLPTPNTTTDTPTFSVYIPRISSTLAQIVAKQAARGGASVLLCGERDAGTTSCAIDFLQRLSCFSSRGLTTVDGLVSSGANSKAEDKFRISNMRMATTFIISSMASKMKRKLHSTAKDTKNVPHFAHDVIMGHIDAGNIIPVLIPLCKSSSSDYIECAVLQLMQRERRNILEPPPGKVMALFFDDIHLPTSKFPSPHGTIRSILELHQMYKSNEVEPQSVENAIIIATSSSEYTSLWNSNENSPAARLLSRFFPIQVEKMPANELYHVFHPVLTQHFERQDIPIRYAMDIRQQIGVVLAISIDMFNNLQHENASFRLKHLLNFFQQLLLPNAAALPTLDTFIRLWRHESYRVFFDANASATVADELNNSYTILRERTGATSYPNEPIWSFKPCGLIKTEMSVEKQVEARTLARRQNSSSLVTSLENTVPANDDCLVPLYEELACGKDSVDYDHSRLQSQLEPLLPIDFSLTMTFVAPLLRLCRLLGIPGCRFILSGYPGQGKRKLIEAAAQLMTHSIVHYESIADGDQGFTIWRNTLKNVVHDAGVQQQDITLIIENPDTFSEKQLADLVCIMQGREVPMLFTNEEQELMARKVKDDKLSVMTAKHETERKALLSTMLTEKDEEMRNATKSESVRQADLEKLDQRHDAKIQRALEALINVQHGETDDLLRQFEANVDVNIAIGLSVTKPVGVLTGIWNDIVHAMSKNLRVVVCTNDVTTLISRAPKLESICQIINTSIKHSQASIMPICNLRLESAMSIAIEKRALSNDMIECVRDNLDILCTICVVCHTSASEIATKHSNISPITLHHIPRFARIYFNMLVHFRTRIDQATASPKSFLKVVEMLQAEVFNAKDKERAILADIEAKTAAINALKVELTSTQAKADHIRAGMRQRKADVDTQVAITNEIERMTQNEMKGAMKILDDANAAVASLDKRYIIEIKSFIHPPNLVHLTLNAICVLYSIEPSWENARRLLGDANFITTMLNYDKDNVSEETLEKLVPFIENPLFNQSEVEKQSVAAGIMISWITAVNTYCNVRKVIKPKLDILESAHTKLKNLVSDFTQCKADLDAADKLTSDIEHEIQFDMHAKKDMLCHVEEVQYLLGKGSSAILQLASESSSVTQYLDSMIEYESYIIVEAALATALMVYATGFTATLYDELLEVWKRELAASDFNYRFNHPKSILNDIAKHPFGNWLYNAGLFHSKSRQAAAYVIGFSVPIVLISNYSIEVKSMILRVFDALNIDDPIVWKITDKDIKSTFETCKVMGKPLLIEGIDYNTLALNFGDLLEFSNSSGTEQISLKEDGVPAHPSFRLILTSSGSLDLINTASPCLHINAQVFTECYETMLVDDMCHENVSNSSRQTMTAIVHALEISRSQQRKAQNNLIEHIREMLTSMKFPTEELDKLKDLCLHNVQTRQDILKLETDIEVTLAHYRSRSCRQLAWNGSNFYTALSRQPFHSISFDGFRKLFIQAQVNATHEWMTPKDLLAQMMSRLARSIPVSDFRVFAWLVTLQVFTNAQSINLTMHNQGSCGLYDTTRHQLEMFLPSGLASATTPDMIKLIQRCTSEDLLVGLQVLQPIAKRRRAYPEFHEHIDLVVAYLTTTNPTLHQLCLILKVLLPQAQYDALWEQFVSDTLDDDFFESYRQNVNMPEWSHALLTPTTHILPFGLQTCTLHGTLGFLKDLLDTVLSMRIQVKLLHSLLQRPQVSPLLRWKLPHHDQINNKYLIAFSSLEELTELEEITPNLLSQFAWRSVYLSDTQRLPEYLSTSTPLSHQSSTVAEATKPAIHIWAFNDAIPKPLKPLCQVVNPMGMSTFARAMRDTLLALVSIPFSPQIADILQAASLEEACKTTIGILIWRLLSGLTFFHAVLLTRQECTFGSQVDHYPFGSDDITLCMMELLGPLMKWFIRSFTQHKETTSYKHIDWVRIRTHLFDHVYSRKLKTQRIRLLIHQLLEECVNSHLVADSIDASLMSKFHLPLHQFFSLFQDANITTAEDYLRVLCEFASTTDFAFRDAPVYKKTASYDIHTVLLQTDATIQVKVISGFAAFLQSLLDQMPNPLVLKLHPRNAVKLTPMRQLLKSLIQQHQADRESFIANLQALIPQTNWSRLPRRTQKRMTEVLNDELGASLEMKSLAGCGVNFTGYLGLMQQQSTFLQAWWDEEHVEYWCPSIIAINELISTFLITYGVQFNRDTSQLFTVIEVYPSQATIPDAARRRDEILVLTGLTLVNGTPVPIAVKESPGKQFAIKLLVRVLDVQPVDAVKDIVECPILRSQFDPTVVASIPLRISPSMAKWSSCLYMFLSR